MQADATSSYVFANERGDGPLSVFTIEGQHAKSRAALKLTSDFVIHSLRHTLLMRLGEAHPDAFVLMKVAGHSTVTISQRYVHPSAEAQERAFERFQQLNSDRNGAEDGTAQRTSDSLQFPRHLRMPNCPKMQ